MGAYDFFGAIAGIVATAIFGAVVFGAFLVLDDIRNWAKSIESKNEPNT